MLRFMKNTKGQAVVEFALVLPILVFLLLAIMEGGRIFGSYLELQHAARDGARWAAVHTEKTREQVTDYVKGRLAFLDDSKLDQAGNVVLNRDPARNEWVKLTLEYPLEILTPIISNLLGNPFNLKTEMTMRCE